MTAVKPKRAAALGVSDIRYQELLALQGGGCAICGNPPKTRRLNVDHDHASKDNRVRGLLCFRCNRGLPHYATVKWLWHALAYVAGPDSWEAEERRRRYPSWSEAPRGEA